MCVKNDERRCVNSVTAPVAFEDACISSDGAVVMSMGESISSDLGPAIFEDACVSSDGAVVMSIGEPMSSDMGPKLDIRMKQLKDKLCREKEKALKRNNYKVTLRECLQRKAGEAHAVVQMKQSKHVSAEGAVERRKRRRPAGADVVVQTKQSKHVGKRSKRFHQNAVLPESVKKIRRLKAKLKKRRQRQKMKEDPVALKRHLAQEKIRQQRRKENGSIRPISELKPREQRCWRKQWRINTRRYREKKAHADAAQSEETETVESETVSGEKNVWVEERSGDKM